MPILLSQSLPTLSLVVSIVVIVCMAISFAVLFLLYGKTKSKSIGFGVEDGALKTELGKRHKDGGSYAESLERDRKREKGIRIAIDVFLAALVAFVGAMAIFALVLRSKGEQIYFGDTAYLTILTSSMQEKNEDNEYLKENDDGVRIHQYALIGIDKVDPADLDVGDIIAFKYEGNTVYVHRIVEVRELNGERYFTTMGDANSVSGSREINISSDRIVGVFNGYHDGYLGVMLIYMRSDIGLVAIIFVFFLLAAIDVAEYMITRSYEKRQKLLVAELDGAQQSQTATDRSTEETTEEPSENQTEVSAEQRSDAQTDEQTDDQPIEQPTEQPSEEPNEHSDQPTEEHAEEPTEEQPDEPIEEATDEPIEEPSDDWAIDGADDATVDTSEESEDESDDDPEDAVPMMIRYDRSFTARLILSSDITKDFYEKLKRKLLSYKKVRCKRSWRHEAFTFSNKGTVARLVIRGKTLQIRLPYPVEVYAESGLKLEAFGARSIVRIRGTGTLTRAIRAVDVTMAKLGASPCAPENFAYDLPQTRTVEELIGDGLIKIRHVKAFGRAGAPVESEEPAEPEQIEEAQPAPDDSWVGERGGATTELEPVQADDGGDDDDVPLMVVYDKSFAARLILSDAAVKEFYGKLKNRLLSYSRMRSVQSWRHEAFKFSNKGTVARLIIRGKTLCVRLPFAADAYAAEGIKVDGKGARSTVRVKGAVTLNRALKAIDVTMKKLNVAFAEAKNVNYELPTRTLEELIGDKLVKLKTVKAGFIKPNAPAGDGNE